MSKQTQVIWDMPIDENTVAQIIAKDREMIDAGKQQGNQVNTEGPGANQRTIVRTWVDLAAATEWINFINSLGPVSATIIN